MSMYHGMRDSEHVKAVVGRMLDPASMSEQAERLAAERQSYEEVGIDYNDVKDRMSVNKIK